MTDRNGAIRGKEITTHGFREDFTASVLQYLSDAFCHERSTDHCLVWLDVNDGRDADARRLDDVDGVDAAGWTDLAGSYDIIRWHVVRDDGGNDAALVGADTVSLSRAARQGKRNAPELADRA